MSVLGSGSVALEPLGQLGGQGGGKTPGFPAVKLALGSGAAVACFSHCPQGHPRWGWKRRVGVRGSSSRRGGVPAPAGRAGEGIFSSGSSCGRPRSLAGRGKARAGRAPRVSSLGGRRGTERPGCCPLQLGPLPVVRPPPCSPASWNSAQAGFGMTQAPPATSGEAGVFALRLSLSPGVLPVQGLSLRSRCCFKQITGIAPCPRLGVVKRLLPSSATSSLPRGSVLRSLGGGQRGRTVLPANAPC